MMRSGLQLTGSATRRWRLKPEAFLPNIFLRVMVGRSPLAMLSKLDLL